MEKPGNQVPTCPLTNGFVKIPERVPKGKLVRIEQRKGEDWGKRKSVISKADAGPKPIPYPHTHTHTHHSVRIVSNRRLHVHPMSPIYSVHPGKNTDAKIHYAERKAKKKQKCRESTFQQKSKKESRVSVGGNAYTYINNFLAVLWV